MAISYEAYLKSFLALAFWYVTNVSTVILNKYVFQIAEFHYPLTLTGMHFIYCAILSTFVLRVIRPSSIPVINISSADRFQKVFPFAGLFCLNIVLGNVSLRYVPVSFMQTVKSLVPAFTVGLQALLGTHFSRNIYMSIVPVVGGVLLATWTESEFNMIGFLAALMGSVTGASMVVMGGRLMDYKLDPINLLYHMAPPSLALLLPFVYFMEFDGVVQFFLSSKIPQSITAVVITASSVIAFLLNWSQFLVIAYTSSLTLTVAGNLKAAIAIILSILIFHNKVTGMNILGCMAAVGGVTWYGLVRHKESQAKAPSVAADMKGASQEELKQLVSVSSEVLDPTTCRSKSITERQ